MRNAIFLALLLAAVVYAIRRGGGPEKAMAGIAALMVSLDWLLHLAVPPEFASLDVGHLAIDIFGASVTFLLAMVAHRFWPLPMAALHYLPLLAHSSRTVDVAIDPVAYLTMQVASSWPVPLLLILATWRHQRRIRQVGSEPSWHRSWLPSRPTTPIASPRR